MNNVVLYGNLAKDPEINVINTSFGKQVTVARITVAVSRSYTKANGEKCKEVTFIPCEAWDSGAEILGQYRKKGDPILVEGALKMDSWEKDGQKHSRMLVRISNFELLYRKAKPENTQSEELPAPTEEF